MLFFQDLKGKRVVVTGAAAGIGEATADRLLQLGAHVIAVDVRPPSVRVQQYVSADLADQQSIEAAVGHVQEPLHGLCNIAGVPGNAAQEKVLLINYAGLRHLTESLLGRLVPGAAIVNMASVAGGGWVERTRQHVELARTRNWDEAVAWLRKNPVPEDQSYQYSKEALIVWTLLRAPEFSRRYGIRMNCVSPGPVATGILEDFRRSLGEDRIDHAIHMVGRPASPGDVSPTVLFLLSEASRWVVGANLINDGGLAAARLAEQWDFPLGVES